MQIVGILLNIINFSYNLKYEIINIPNENKIRNEKYLCDYSEKFLFAIYQ